MPHVRGWEERASERESRSGSPGSTVDGSLHEDDKDDMENKEGEDGEARSRRRAPSLKIWLTITQNDHRIELYYYFWAISVIVVLQLPNWFVSGLK